jgi:hypothetical protein
VKLRYLLAACLCAVAGPSWASGEVFVHVGSVHSAPGYNNVNPGLGYARPDGRSVGVYRNSYRRTTVYAAQTYETRADRFTAGVVLGAGTGYQKQGRWPVSPLIAGTASARVAPGTRVRLLYVPPTGKAAAALHLTVGYVFAD